MVNSLSLTQFSIEIVFWVNLGGKFLVLGSEIEWKNEKLKKD
jgi:hypothetical protein